VALGLFGGALDAVEDFEEEDGEEEDDQDGQEAPETGGPVGLVVSDRKESIGRHVSPPLSRRAGPGSAAHGRW
jgi:hypothetical protein